SDGLAIVHNGIIENHSALRSRLSDMGYMFTSETDTEVVAHLIAAHYRQSGSVLTAFRAALQELHGAYALALVHEDEPDTLYCARTGRRPVIAVGCEEPYLASDPLALLQVTDRFRYLEEGGHAQLTCDGCSIWDARDQIADRPVQQYEHAALSMDRGEYRHYMLKEVFEQPQAIADTLTGTLGDNHVLTAILGPDAESRLADVRHIHIVACGTSFHAGLVARYWIESQVGLPCQVEVA